MNLGSDLSSNIWKLFLIRISKWFMVYMPVIVLFFESKGWSLAEVMMINAIYSMVIAFFEIPSGYLSDRWIRKNVMLLGTSLILFQFIFYSYCGHSLMFAIFGAVFGGIGASLISGTDSALLYDSLSSLKKEDTYLKWEGRTYGIGTFSEAIAAVFAGYLAYYGGLGLPIYIQIWISFLGVFAALLIKEPPRYKGNDLPLKDFAHTLKKDLWNNRNLKLALFLSAITGSSCLILAWFAQPYFDFENIHIQKIDVLYIGYLWSALNITVAFSAFFAHRIIDHFKKYKVMLLILAIFTIGFFGLSTLGVWSRIFGLLFLMLMYVARGLSVPLLIAFVNKETRSDNRATVLSIRSFMTRISYALLAPLLGHFVDVFSIAEAFLIMGSIMIFSMFYVGLNLRILKKLC